jgi:hypothetical protein
VRYRAVSNAELVDPDDGSRVTIKKGGRGLSRTYVDEQSSLLKKYPWHFELVQDRKRSDRAGSPCGDPVRHRGGCVRYTGAAVMPTPAMPIPWAAEIVTKPGQLAPVSGICTVLSAPWPTPAYVHHRAWETIRTESTWRSAVDLCETGGYLVGTDLDVLVSRVPARMPCASPSASLPILPTPRSSSAAYRTRLCASSGNGTFTSAARGSFPTPTCRATPSGAARWTCSAFSR